MGKRRRQPQSLDMFALGEPKARETERGAQAKPAAAPRSPVATSPTFRLSRPICLEVDLTGEAASYAVVDQETGERVTALSREELVALGRK